MTHEPRDPVCGCTQCDDARRAKIIARCEAYFRYHHWMRKLRAPLAQAETRFTWDGEESGVRPTVRPPRLSRKATQHA